MTDMLLRGTGINYGPDVSHGWWGVTNILLDDFTVAEYQCDPGEISRWVILQILPNQIPTAAIMEGFKVKIKKRNVDDFDVYDADLYMLSLSGGIWSAVSDNKAQTAVRWPGGDLYYVTYGSDANTWSFSSNTALINSGNFGIGFRVTKIGGSFSAGIWIDYLEAIVYYSTGGVVATDIYGPLVQAI